MEPTPPRPVPPAVADAIARDGSIRFDQFVDLALYGPDGFFAGGAGAGRAGGDFITSPEVGPLFGAVVARHLDQCWNELGRPDPFVVVEAGAGRGALAVSVLAAQPDCAPALRYLMVERSEQWRSQQGRHLALVNPFEILGGDADDEDPELTHTTAGSGPMIASLVDLPSVAVDGIVVANELLDNLAPRLFERAADSWMEVRVTMDASDPDVGLIELLVPADGTFNDRLESLAPAAAPGARLPVCVQAQEWLAEALAVIRRGSVLVIDYADRSAALASRHWRDWLRTYRGHERGSSVLDAVGEQDITCEVPWDQLARVAPPTSVTLQADWLRGRGIDELVAEGRAAWAARSGVGDLAAVRGRSRVVEADALLDPSGLGSFTVIEWKVG